MVRLIRRLSSFFEKLAVWAEWKKIRYELRRYPELERLLRKFQDSPEAGWTIAENDVIRLYQLVLAHKPQQILELGTGIGFSTAVMASALAKIGRGHIASLEQLPKCIEIANTLIDRDLKQFVTLVHAPPIVFKVERISKWLYFCGYDWQPPPGQQFDFVFVDGPAGWIQDGELVSLDSGDVIRILPCLVPGAMVYIDGRRSIVKKLKRYLGRYLTLVEASAEFAVFKRTSEPLAALEGIIVEDTKLARGRHTPYAVGAARVED